MDKKIADDIAEAFHEGYKGGYQAGYENGKRDAVKHGYWIGEFSKERLSLDEDGRVETGFECAVCSECGEDLLASEEYFVRGRYCPACGAKMDGKESGE